MIKTEIHIGGMSCAMCVNTIEKGLKNTSGIVDVSVNLATETAHVSYNPDSIDLESIQKKISSLGYTCELEPRAPMSTTNLAEGFSQNKAPFNLSTYTKSPWFKVFLGFIFCSPLLLGMLLMIWPFNFETKAAWIHFLHQPWWQILWASPVQWWLGYSFHRKAIISLKYRVLGMDFLISLGSTAAYVFSIYQGFILHSHDLYFEAGAVVITLVLMGKALESGAKWKSTSALRELLALTGNKARRILPNGNEEDVLIENLVMTDVCSVKPGERIPVDGIILSGETTIDESSMSGESMPVDKTLGEHVWAGTQNLLGAITIKTTALGAATMLSQIAAKVEEAMTGKAPIQRVADRIASYFAPAILLIAACTWIVYALMGAGEKGLIHAIAVLVVACPCALGLATPTALIVGMGIGAKRGILFRSAEVIEKAKKIDTIFFDKTGTLTLGKPEVRDVVISPTINEQYFWEMLYTAEKNSEHPLASAVSIEAKKHLENVNIAPDSFTAVMGKGVIAHVQNSTLYCGTINWMHDLGLTTSLLDTEISSWQAKGYTIMLLAADLKILGAIALSDTLREESSSIIATLKEKHFETGILSGDNIQSTTWVANSLGITHIYAPLLPTEKADNISGLIAQGRQIAMVGDGINDALALQTATLGIAMGSGTSIAMSSADMVLIGGDLRKLVIALDLARQTLSTIYRNLFWAFLYNVLMIPLAVLGYLNPMLAGAAMAMSSVSVVLSSLWLKRSYTSTTVNINPLTNHTNKENMMEKSTLTVTGMTCGHCKMAVEKAAKSVAGISEASVNLATGSLTISATAPDQIEKVKEVVRDAGYGVV